jgi:hypothetical protein
MVVTASVSKITAPNMAKSVIMSKCDLLASSHPTSVSPATATTSRHAQTASTTIARAGVR